MDNAIHIDQNAGRIAYYAWRNEFATPDWESWDELTKIAQDQWQEIAEAVLEDRIQLPAAGVEVTFRTPNGLRGFVWTGAADTQMKDMVTGLLFKAMSGELK